MKRLGISLAILVLLALGWSQSLVCSEWIAAVVSQVSFDTAGSCSSEGVHLVKGGGRATERLPLEEFAAACDPAMDFEGRTLLFAGRRSAGGPIRVWTLDMETFQVSALSPAALEARKPVALPDGSVVFLSAGDLWRQGPENVARQITYSRGAIRSAAVLPDGRILYLHRSARGGRLFTVLPDGTWSTIWPGLKDLSVRDFNIVDREHLLVLTTGEDLWRMPIANPFAPGQRVPADIGGPIRGLYRAQEGSTYLIAETGGKSESFSTRVAALHLDPKPRLSVLEEYDGGSVVSLDAATAARQAEVLPSIVKPEQESGFLFIIDVARTDDPQLAGLDRDDIAELRIHRWEDSGERTTLFAIEPESDGSVYVEAPADTPLAIDLVDDHGQVLAETSTAIWVRPNERRGCIGCHVSPAYAPPNIRPQALIREPHRLGSSAQEDSP